MTRTRSAPRQRRLVLRDSHHAIGYPMTRQTAVVARAARDEAGAYERFLRRRRRHAVAAASTGLAVGLVLALAVGTALVAGGGAGTVAGPASPATTTLRTPVTGPPSSARPQTPETTVPAPPPVPVSPTGVVRRERQGFELTLPGGWKVDQVSTRCRWARRRPRPGVLGSGAPRGGLLSAYRSRGSQPA